MAPLRRTIVGQELDGAGAVAPDRLAQVERTIAPDLEVGQIRRRTAALSGKRLSKKVPDAVARDRHAVDVHREGHSFGE